MTPASSNGGPLAGRRALVTGASRGIGAEIVRKLASDGASVAFTYGSSAAEAEKLAAEAAADGATVVAIQADSGDPEQVRRSVEETVTHLGGLDILVNNAGIAVLGDVATLPAEKFDRIVAINIRGVFVAIQAALAHLGEGGRIINIGSINAEKVPGPGLAVYAMTKAAVAGLTRGLARDLGPQGITVNNVQPGPIDTDMNRTKANSPKRQSKSWQAAATVTRATSRAWSRIWQAPTPDTSPVRTGTSTAGSRSRG